MFILLLYQGLVGSASYYKTCRFLIYMVHYYVWHFEVVKNTYGLWDTFGRFIVWKKSHSKPRCATSFTRPMLPGEKHELLYMDIDTLTRNWLPVGVDREKSNGQGQRWPMSRDGLTSLSVVCFYTTSCNSQLNCHYLVVPVPLLHTGITVMVSI